MTSIAWAIMFVGVLACAIAADIAGYKLDDAEMQKLQTLLVAFALALAISSVREWMR